MTDKAILYLHGLPGSFSSDMEIVFGPGKPPDGVSGLERLMALGGNSDYGAAVIDAFDIVVGARRKPDPVHIVAFSLGAMPAMIIAAARPGSIAALDLIAPAAPLQLGNFLPDMAGKPVFDAASRSEFRLGLLIRAQSAALKLAPGLIARQLFAAAPQTERSLMSTAERLKAFLDGMRYALLDNARSYRAELLAYVSDWTEMLPKVTRPVRIWQGTDDNWTPPAMTRALTDRLGGPTEIQSLAGLSHYGALLHALPEIILHEAFK